MPDGTPSPETSKPGFIPVPNDILDTKVVAEGGRTITLQQIKPIALPETKVSAPALDVSNPAVQARIEEMQAQSPDNEFLRLGACVHLFKNSPPRTLVTFWPGGPDGPITFWSSADFSLLSGFSDYKGADGKTRSLFMMWSTVYADDMPAADDNGGHQTQSPQIPVFPAGTSTFVISGNQPSAESLAAIQSLHDFYNNEHDRLKAAHDSREQARIQREAELKAHPPQPKNMVLNYWITQTPEGGGK